MNGVVHIPYPNPYRPILATRPGEDYGEAIVRYLEKEIFNKVLPHQEVAGILVESIQGEGGYIVPTPGFYPALRQLCDKLDILLIVDEVQSGMGRTGKWWAIEHFGIEPDIVCVGKGVASGVPLGAIIARKSVSSWGAGTHGNTYGGNPLACAAALATIDLIRDGFMQNAAEVGAYALDALQEIQVRHPSIGDVRGRGLMIGVEFVMDRETKEIAHDLRDRVEKLAFERGLLTLGCGSSVIRIAPPLNITKQEMDDGLEILEEAVTLAEKEFELLHAA
jgi:4-aminobutyrate aminotransferase